MPSPMPNLTHAQKRMIRDAYDKGGGTLSIGLHANRLRSAQDLADQGLLTIRWVGSNVIDLTAEGWRIAPRISLRKG